MQNWYCLVNFPDGTDEVRLIPGPAPVPMPGDARPVVKIAGETGLWTVLDINLRIISDHYAAEIWVERHQEDYLGGNGNELDRGSL